MLSVTPSGNGYSPWSVLLNATVTASGATVRHAYQVVLGRVMSKREAAYFNTFHVTADQANDPQYVQDKKDRAIVSARLDGFSLNTARLSVKMLVPAVVDGAPTMTANPLFGVVDAYRQSVSRAALGLKPHLSDRKSGKRKRRPQVKKSNRWRRLWMES